MTPDLVLVACVSVCARSSDSIREPDIQDLNINCHRSNETLYNEVKKIIIVSIFALNLSSAFDSPFRLSVRRSGTEQSVDHLCPYTRIFWSASMDASCGTFDSEMCAGHRDSASVRPPTRGNTFVSCSS